MHGPKNPSGTGNQVSNPDLIAALDRLKGAFEKADGSVNGREGRVIA